MGGERKGKEGEEALEGRERKGEGLAYSRRLGPRKA